MGGATQRARLRRATPLTRRRLRAGEQLQHARLFRRRLGTTRPELTPLLRLEPRSGSASRARAIGLSAWEQAMEERLPLWRAGGAVDNQRTSRAVSQKNGRGG